MKGLPPPAPPKIGGELQPPDTQALQDEKKAPRATSNVEGNTSPLLDKEGVGGGGVGEGLHNKPILKTRRKELRNASTPAERKLWGILKHSQLYGYKFRRQHSVSYYILDFYCPSELLAIEVDGDSHVTDEAIAYDRERTLYLNSLNIRVFRFLNTDVYNNLESVFEKIVEEMRIPSLPPPAPPKIGGE